MESFSVGSLRACRWAARRGSYSIQRPASDLLGTREETARRRSAADTAYSTNTEMETKLTQSPWKTRLRSHMRLPRTILSAIPTSEAGQPHPNSRLELRLFPRKHSGHMYSSGTLISSRRSLVVRLPLSPMLEAKERI